MLRACSVVPSQSRPGYIINIRSARASSSSPSHLQELTLGVNPPRQPLNLSYLRSIHRRISIVPRTRKKSPSFKAKKRKKRKRRRRQSQNAVSLGTALKAATGGDHCRVEAGSKHPSLAGRGASLACCVASPTENSARLTQDEHTARDAGVARFVS